VFLLLTQSTLSRADNIKNCVARMGHIPAVVASAKKNLTNAPKVCIETAIRQNQGSIAFYERGVFDLAGETPQLSELKTAATPVVACLKDYQKFLEEDLARRPISDWRLGKEKFARKLELELDAGLTADEVLREAEAEADRVEREMYVLARQLW